MSSIAEVADRSGETLARFGLVSVIAWVGGMKFTTYEAEAISGFVNNSVLMSWVYHIFSVSGFSSALGVFEIGIAALIAAGIRFRKLGAVGAALASGMFLGTLSFMVTTPGVFESTLGGFPALSVVPGQFLVKDLALLGLSIWLFGRSVVPADGDV